MKTFTLGDSQQAGFTVGDSVDKRGNPAPMDGEPVVESSDTSLITVEPHSDGAPRHYLMKAVGPLSSAAIITITGDAAAGSDVDSFVENIAVEITAEKAAGFGVTFEAPEEQP